MRENRYHQREERDLLFIILTGLISLFLMFLSWQAREKGFPTLLVITVGSVGFLALSPLLKVIIETAFIVIQGGYKLLAFLLKEIFTAIRSLPSLVKKIREKRFFWWEGIFRKSTLYINKGWRPQQEQAPASASELFQSGRTIARLSDPTPPPWYKI